MDLAKHSQASVGFRKMASKKTVHKGVAKRKKRNKSKKRKRLVTPKDIGELLFRRAARSLGFWRPEVVDNLVVSLTTFQARIDKVHLVVQSLLNQSLQPGKIVLYLSLQEFPDRIVPARLGRLASDRFEVRFVSENLRPHNKLQFALSDFPEAWIVTCDDDRLYSPDCLARLWEVGSKNPRTIVCTRGRRAIIEDGKFQPYRNWPCGQSFEASFWLFPLGSWGVLYPPRSLDALVGNRDLIRRLAPLQDDFWLKAMSLKQDIPCREIGGDNLMPQLEFENNTRLWTVNREQNDATLGQLFGHLNLTVESIADREQRLHAPTPSFSERSNPTPQPLCTRGLDDSQPPAQWVSNRPIFLTTSAANSV
jgi:hypothetical protein